MKNKKELDALERALLRQQRQQQEDLEQAWDEQQFAHQWQGLEARLEGEEKELNPVPAQEKVVPIRYLWRAVAGLTALLLLTWGYHFYTLTPTEEVLGGAQENSPLPPELQQAEKASFATLRQDLKALQERDTAQWITPHTLETLEELEEEYETMKTALLEDQNARILVDKMLENLRLRHQILEASVQELERIQQHSQEQQNYTEL